MNIFENKNFIEASDNSKEISIAYKALKLNEEAGEVNQEILKLLDSPNSSKSAGGTPDKVVEELADLSLVIFDIVRQLGKEKEYQNYFETKIKKWNNKFKKGK